MIHMQKQKQHTARVNDQILRMRRLYSQIGEPLPVDVIIDFCQYLDKALEIADGEEKTLHSKKAACRRLN